MSIPTAQLPSESRTVDFAPRTGAPATPAAPTTNQETTSKASTVPAVSFGSDLSTDVRVDDRRHVYYETVNNRTGEVVCEIPPEVIRKLAESLEDVPQALWGGHTVDVES